jgi:predicted glutamate--cysteine ligase
MIPEKTSLLLKGFEIEIYTGTPQGEVVGLSDQVVANLEGYKQEPDSRMVECITTPLSDYNQIACAILQSYQKLRTYLKSIGGFTLIPGSALHLEGSDRFYRSDPANTFHGYVAETYGSKLLTCSVHINIGLDDPELITRACRLIRVEAPLYLALSASSPFLDGQVTGRHSTRWPIFPKTPPYLPLFESHSHYISWVEEQLALGTMKNVRHMWNSVRPNGNNRPYDINRIEMRICDLIENPITLLAITALLEARLWQLIEDPNLDPLKTSNLPEKTRSEDLLQLTEANEIAVANRSLDAELQHWQDGKKVTARNWLREIYQEVWNTAESRGFSSFLIPLQTILEEGNTAQRWLKLYDQGWDIRKIIQQAIQDMEFNEQIYRERLCL